MKLQTVITVSFQNLWRRRLRSVLTIWGLSVGIGAMLLLISFAEGLQQQAKESFLGSASLTELTVQKQDPRANMGSTEAPKPFTSEEVTTLRNISHVRVAALTVNMPPTSLSFGDHTADNAFFMPKLLETVTKKQREQLLVGSYWENNDAHAIVVAEDTAKTLQVEPKDLVGKEITINIQWFSQTGQKKIGEQKATVSGVIKKDTSGFGSFGGGNLVSYGFADFIAQEAAKTEPELRDVFGQSTVNIVVDDQANVPAVREAIKQLTWYATGFEEILKEISQGFFIMKIVLGIIGGIALFVALIGITNSMLMAVLERTREIGILVSLGASRRTVSWLFLSEAGWLGLFGAVVGILGSTLIGQAIVAGVRAYLAFKSSDQNFPIAYSLTWTAAVAALVGSVFVTMLAGWLPARRAAKQDPVKALRHE